MKIWQAYGSEHSMRLVMIGRFRTATDAKKTQQLIVEIGKDKDGRIFLLTPHPAFYTHPDNSFKWKWNDLPTDSLEKAFKQAREIYLGN